MSFGNIINNKNNIMSNFNTFSKGIEIVKTEKDVYDSLSNAISKMETIQFQIQGMKKEIESLLGGEKPSEERTYYMSTHDAINGDVEVKYLTYPLNKECDNCQPNTQLTNLVIDTMSNQRTEDGEALKSKYNDLCRRFLNIQEKKIGLEKVKNNLKKNSNREYRLSLNDLEQYGF